MHQRKRNADVHHGGGNDESLQAKLRHANVDREQHTDNGAKGIPRVDLADTGFAVALGKKGKGNQRQRHARAECGGKHDGQGNRVADKVEERIGEVRFGER